MRYYLVMLLCTFFVKPLYAATWGADCEYTINDINITIPSGKKVTIDPDAPLGTVFYEHSVNVPSAANLKCRSPNNYSRQDSYIYSPGGQTVTMTGYGLIGGGYPVYKTNVPGVGVLIRVGTSAVPWWSPVYPRTGSKLDYSGLAMKFDVDIVKYGDIPAGASTVTIDSTVVPAVEWTASISASGNTHHLPNGDVLMVRANFTATTFDVLTGTCDTPDVVVNLGIHRTSEINNREAGKFATPWTDASIRLINCPVFYGTGRRELRDATRDNLMTITLMPGNATTSNQGIMPIDNISYAATGVGIQLAYGTTASPQLVDFSAGKGTKTYTMSSTQGSTYTIPLVARYIQTASAIGDILPGKANGKITYLINYE